MQEQTLMAAPLIVQDAAKSSEDRQEVVLMLHDFTFRTPDEVLVGSERASPTRTPWRKSPRAVNVTPPIQRIRPFCRP
jgi:hypothetical protein